MCSVLPHPTMPIKIPKRNLSEVQGPEDNSAHSDRPIQILATGYTLAPSGSFLPSSQLIALKRNEPTVPQSPTSSHPGDIDFDENPFERVIYLDAEPDKRRKDSVSLSVSDCKIPS